MSWNHAENVALVQSLVAQVMQRTDCRKSHTDLVACSEQISFSWRERSDDVAKDKKIRATCEQEYAANEKCLHDIARHKHWMLLGLKRPQCSELASKFQQCRSAALQSSAAAADNDVMSKCNQAYGEAMVCGLRQLLSEVAE